MNIKELQKWIKIGEGHSLYPYVDTVGKVTIGFGRNLSDLGISETIAETFFSEDFNRAFMDMSSLDWFHTMPRNIQCALINMCFNLGLTKFLKFKRMIHALKNKDFKKAAIEGLDSKWATQVGDRAKDIVLMIRESSS